jgi:uncharacterized membrane protein YdjX (TVP38/TMEM64 family)
MRRRLAPVLLILALLAVPAVLLQGDALRSGVISLVAYLHRAGPLGLLPFAFAQIVALVLALPLWLMSGVAGYVYGFPWGFLIALPGQTIASCAAFLVGRTLLRRRIEERAAARPFFRAVSRAVETDGLKITLLLRVAIVLPQPILNYLLSTTRLRGRKFALGTLIGFVPSTLLHVYLGSVVESAATLISGEARPRGPLTWVLPALGLVVTVTAVVMTSWLAKRALKDALTEPPGEGT